MGIRAAFVGGMVTSKLRLSPIVGYLLAGIITWSAAYDVFPQ
jgi:predicted Kef-type K+ transport protein